MLMARFPALTAVRRAAHSPVPTLAAQVAGRKRWGEEVGLDAWNVGSVRSVCRKNRGACAGRIGGGACAGRIERGSVCRKNRGAERSVEPVPEEQGSLWRKK